MHVPDDLRYTPEHEWAREAEGSVRVGITDYAQDALGDVVFVQLPEVGKRVAKGEALGEVESTKSVSEIYSPVSGEVLAVNSELENTPELLNSDPYGRGWICDISVDDRSALDGLLDAAGYAELTAD